MSYSSEVLADSPDLHWRFAEASGTAVADSSGNSRVATYGAGVALNQTSLLSSDLANKAAVFAAVANSKVTANANATANYSGTGSFSIECWFKATTVDATGRRIFWKYLAAGTTGWSVYFSNTYFRFEREISGGADDVFDVGAPTAGATYHLVCTYDGATMRMYLNGAQVGTHSSTFSMTSLNDSPLYVGNLPADTGRFVGTIDEVATYPTALSAARVLAHYQAGLATLYASTILADSPDFYWRLDEPSGTAVADASGNSRVATYGAGVTLNQTSLLLSDTVDKSAVFLNVANSIVTANANATANYSGTAPFTLECWCFPTTLDATLRRLFNHSGATDAILVYASSTAITFERDSSGSGGADDVAAGAALAASTINHVVCTFDGAVMLVYVNGTQVATHAATASLGTLAANPLLIGDNGAGTRRFIGNLDEVAGYPSALSAARVLAHYQAGLVAVPARMRSLMGVGV